MPSTSPRHRRATPSRLGTRASGGCLLDFRGDGVCALTVVCGEREANEVGAEQAAPVDDAARVSSLSQARAKVASAPAASPRASASSPRDSAAVSAPCRLSKAARDAARRIQLVAVDGDQREHSVRPGEEHLETDLIGQVETGAAPGRWRRPNGRR